MGGGERRAVAEGVAAGAGRQGEAPWRGGGAGAAREK